MAFLFDTNALSEIYRRQPNPEYIRWLGTLDRARCFTSMTVVAELYSGAFRASNPVLWFQRIEEELLTQFTVLLFDLECARECGRLMAELARAGTPIGMADVQIAATARVHNLKVVTANLRHFGRIPDLPLETFEPGAQRR